MFAPLSINSVLDLYLFVNQDLIIFSFSDYTSLRFFNSFHVHLISPMICWSSVYLLSVFMKLKVICWVQSVTESQSSSEVRKIIRAQRPPAGSAMSQVWKEMLTQMETKPRYRCGISGSFIVVLILTCDIAVSYLWWPTSMLLLHSKEPFPNTKEMLGPSGFPFFMIEHFIIKCWGRKYCAKWKKSDTKEYNLLQYLTLKLENGQCPPWLGAQTPGENLSYPLLGPAKIVWKWELPFESRHAVRGSCYFSLCILSCSIYTSTRNSLVRTIISILLMGKLRFREAE